ncbi:MAG: IS200/IS605 family transposase [Proteobacteria bacterium]|nr:IS200/IS605 family transposase [Pseudomonadota bacterium]
MGSTLTNLLFHTVFSTKDRKRLIKPEIQNELYKYINGIVKGEGGIVLEIGGMPDHIHILFKLKPTHSVSQLIMKVKGDSSKRINEQRKLPIRFSWQDGFGAFSVSESQVEAVKRYINQQENHHKQLSFKEELIEILKRNRIEFDERYLWN